MPDAPALSVIIPHLNAPDALNRCLASLAGQRGDGVPFEVIVVDNGSAQLPDAICGAFGFVRLEQELTPGPGPARSRGAHLARADLLAFIDCDCIAAPGWIAGIHGYFRDHPETDVIGGDVRIHRADAERPTAIEAYEGVYGYRMKLYVERDGYTATCNMAVRRDTFLQVGDFAGISIAEDVDWGRRATAQGIRIDYAPDICIATPARESFSELTRKWDRHIGHDFAELTSTKDRARWTLRSLSLAASPLAEIPRIAGSDRLSGMNERALAFLGLTRIRFYRCRRMLGLLLSGDDRALSGAWRHRG
ncbi:glycosyltransferase family 2 protein [Pseudoruegeria sp. HB172150]|uniref:glycosyltransferase n=1 Tax=Pseudoruegeria sp. HB172150 TaxID=2721164 RepID=UPI001553F5CB|nr:glycosyltransferase family A protein [Pseudoruegeria sp. HB172150]